MKSSTLYNSVFITYVEEIFLNRFDTKNVDTKETGVHLNIIFTYLFIMNYK